MAVSSREGQIAQLLHDRARIPVKRSFANMQEPLVYQHVVDVAANLEGGRP
jgi:hypothetical protein